MLLAEVVAATEAVASTGSRTRKAETLAALLRRAGGAEAAVIASIVAAAPRQGRVGVGFATVSELWDEPAESMHPSLEISDLDTLLDELASTSGDGAAMERRRLVVDLLSRATAAERGFVLRLLLGDLRQGANQGVMVDAISRAAGVPATVVRRALMLSGDLGSTAALAPARGRAGLEEVGLEVLRPIQPMLASTAPDVGVALTDAGRASVEWKLDGVRVQVHRLGGEVRVWSRNLNDVTDRLPEVVAIVAAMPATSLVLDREVVGLTDDESPQAFQDTMGRFGRGAGAGAAMTKLRPWFFDLVHLDGVDLLDAP